MRLDALRQTVDTVATWFERVFPDRAPSVQAVFNHSRGRPGIIQFPFEYTRPALFKR